MNVRWILGHNAGNLDLEIPKTLRHTFAKYLLEQGVDLRYIQEILGHTSIKTKEIYSHIATKGVEKMISPIDGLDI